MTSKYNKSYEDLINDLHNYYLNCSGGYDLSNNVRQYFEATDLEDVAKLTDYLFQKLVNRYGRTWKFKSDVDNLYCIHNNHIIRILQTIENPDKDTFNRHLVNLKSCPDLPEAITQTVKMYKSSKLEGYDEFYAFSQNICEKINTYEENLFQLRCYEDNTNGRAILNGKTIEILEFLIQYGYIKGSYETPSITLFFRKHYWLKIILSLLLVIIVVVVAFYSIALLIGLLFLPAILKLKK